MNNTKQKTNRLRDRFFALWVMRVIPIPEHPFGFHGSFRFSRGAYYIIHSHLNGVVNTTDALLALRHSMNIIALEGQSLLNADVNGDGTVNATDALLIMRIALNVG